MKKIFIWGILVGLMFFLTSCTSGVLPTLNFTADTQAISVKVGQHFTITLQENASTGYIWEDPVISDTSVVKLVKSPRASKDELVGAPEDVTWEFEALAEGSATITFEYKRPWESEPAETKIFSVEVTK